MLEGGAVSRLVILPDAMSFTPPVLEMLGFPFPHLTGKMDKTSEQFHSLSLHQGPLFEDGKVISKHIKP